MGSTQAGTANRVLRGSLRSIPWLSEQTCGLLCEVRVALVGPHVDMFAFYLL
jgi:hypothetical protein